MSAVTVVVPARYASTRLPAKPLAPLAGQPLITRVLRRVADAGVAERVVAAVDHDEVAAAVKQAGFEAVRTAPELPSGTDRVHAACAALELPDDALVLNVQGDEPFVPPEHLSAVVALLRAYPEAVATAAHPLADASEFPNLNVVKAVVGEASRALYFSRAAVPHARDGERCREAPVLRHLGLYAYRVATLRRLAAYPEHALERTERLEQLRWLANGEQIRCTVVGSSPGGIDTPADLARANRHYAELSRLRKPE